MGGKPAQIKGGIKNNRLISKIFRCSVMALAISVTGSISWRVMCGLVAARENKKKVL